MTSYPPPYGFALRRNNTCNTSQNEIDCGPTWASWHVCCMRGSTCVQGKNHNTICCPTESDCSDPLDAAPHCGNETWSLFDAGGYFCCVQGQNAYVDPNVGPAGGVGCSDGYPRDPDTKILTEVTDGTTTTTSMTSMTSATVSSSTTQTSAAPTNTPEADSSATSDSSSNTGAIAGGVVGGVAGLALLIAVIWFLLRRRRQRKSDISPSQPALKADSDALQDKPKVELGHAGPRVELDARSRSEMDAGVTPELETGYVPVQELPANANVPTTR